MSEQKAKAIFWDRDGVLNFLVELRQDGETWVSPQSFKDFRIDPSAAAVIAHARILGFLNIVVTNQPDIARNKMKQTELDQMHNALKALGIDAIYVCPHDTVDACLCRKPKPGMLLQAMHDWNIDLVQSFVVGDAEADFLAAQAAHIPYMHKRNGKPNQYVPPKTPFLLSLKDILNHIL